MGGIVFFDASGRTGKTFWIKLILADISNEQIALVVASFGIAGILFSWCRIAYFYFKLLFNLTLVQYLQMVWTGGGFEIGQVDNMRLSLQCLTDLNLRLLTIPCRHITLKWYLWSHFCSLVFSNKLCHSFQREPANESKVCFKEFYICRWMDTLHLSTQ